MKKYQSMVLLLAVLAVFVILYFAVKLIPEEGEIQEPAVMVTDTQNVVSMQYTDGETTEEATE